MTRTPDLTYHPCMRHLMCVAVALVAACGSDDDGSIGATTLEWKIVSGSLGERSCDQAMALHVDWQFTRSDATMVNKSYDCSAGMVDITLKDGTYTAIHGTLRSTTASVITTCDPGHDNPFSGTSRNVDQCVFNVP